jgi:Eukaryotic-type carbonic anhydrase
VWCLLSQTALSKILGLNPGLYLVSLCKVGFRPWNKENIRKTIDSLQKFVLPDPNIRVQLPIILKLFGSSIPGPRNCWRRCAATGNRSIHVHIFQVIHSMCPPSQLGDLSNAELRMLTDQLDKIRFGGDEAPVRKLSVRGLLPETESYMTYEGSTTAPACHETVTWIVLNKPVYITKQQVRNSIVAMNLGNNNFLIISAINLPCSLHF